MVPGLGAQTLGQTLIFATLASDSSKVSPLVIVVFNI